MAGNRSRSSIGRRLAPMVAALALMLVGHAPTASAAPITVNCATQNLQAKINAAPGGATLVVKGVCVGNFTISRSIILSGTATLDGNDSGPTLTINGNHAIALHGVAITGGLAPRGAGIDREGGGTLTLQGVTVIRNLATGTSASGGGIYSDAGTLTITKSKVVENRAFASNVNNAEAVGGGILSNGPLVVAGSTISSNRATAISFGASAGGRGGGVFEDGGTVTISSSHLDANRAVGRGVQSAIATGGGLSMNGPKLTVQQTTLIGNLTTADNVVPSSSATAIGGAISANVDTATVVGSTFSGDRARATANGGPAQAKGGAVEVEMTTKVTVQSSTFSGGVAAADGESSSASGSAIFSQQSKPVLVTASRFTGGTVTAHAGGSNATAGGGALFLAGATTITRSTLDRNHLAATSDGGVTQANGGGVLANEAFRLTRSTVSRNTAISTTTVSEAIVGGAGILLLGISSDGTITNSTVTGNVGTATSPAGSGLTIADGGGLKTGNQTLAITASTIARNALKGSGDTLVLRGGGISVSSGTVTLRQSILALDTTADGGSPDCTLNVGSAGFNLVGSTTGCNFASKPTDRLHLNPKLGTLGNHGGPTATLPLLAGSPAIDWIPAASCAVDEDQRAIHRPQGPKCDIGAFERGP